MAVTTTSDLNGLYNDILEATLLSARETTLMTNLVTVYNGNSFAPRKVPILAAASAVTKPEGADFVTGQVASKSTKATLTPAMAMAQYILTDEDIMTDPDNARVNAATELGNAIAEKVDRDLIDQFANFSNSKGTAGSVLTIGHCAAAIAAIRDDKARGETYAVLNPFQWHDVWVELGQPAVNQALLGDVANEALRQYYTGTFLGAQWYPSSNVEPDGSDDAIGGMFVRSALAFDVRKSMTLEPERDASKLAVELNMSMGYATSTLWAERGSKLISDATEPTS